MRDNKEETNFTKWVKDIVSGEHPVKQREVKSLEVYDADTDYPTVNMEVECQVIDSDGVPWIITYYTIDDDLTSYSIIKQSDRKK